MHKRSTVNRIALSLRFRQEGTLWAATCLPSVCFTKSGECSCTWGRQHEARGSWTFIVFCKGPLPCASCSEGFTTHCCITSNLDPSRSYQFEELPALQRLAARPNMKSTTPRIRQVQLIQLRSSQALPLELNAAGSWCHGRQWEGGDIPGVSETKAILAISDWWSIWRRIFLVLLSPLNGS